MKLITDNSLFAQKELSVHAKLACPCTVHLKEEPRLKNRSLILALRYKYRRSQTAAKVGLIRRFSGL